MLCMCICGCRLCYSSGTGVLGDGCVSYLGKGMYRLVRFWQILKGTICFAWYESDFEFSITMVCWFAVYGKMPKIAQNIGWLSKIALHKMLVLA